MSWVIHCCLLLYCISLLAIEDCQSLFLRHTRSGKCIAAGRDFYHNEYANRYWAEMVDNCLDDQAQFKYDESELLHNIKIGGSLATFSMGNDYQHRFFVYEGLNTGGKGFQFDSQHSLKQTDSGALKMYKVNVCALPTEDFINETLNCDKEEQSFTFGSVTDYNSTMENVRCSPKQRLVISRADYGNFNNDGKFDFTASIDKKCSSITNCQVKSRCDGKNTCALKFNEDILPSSHCPDVSKEVYVEYTCVDTYHFTSVTTANNLRLSDSPNEGFIQIKIMQNYIWRMVEEKNSDKEHQKKMCQYLGFQETDSNVKEARERVGRSYLTGDMIFYDLKEEIACVHLQPVYKMFKSTSKVNLPYVTCKICDKPLLKDISTFPDPDNIFSGTGPVFRERARFYSSGWCFGVLSEYLMIDLQKEYHITRVVTLGNEDQSKWGESYSLKYSHDKTLVDQSSAVQITGNQNGYRASTTILDIFNVRHLKIEKTGSKDVCLRIELCGEVQQAAPVQNITTKPSNYSVHLSWTIPGPKLSSYIKHFIIYLNGKFIKKISRKKYENQFTLPGLKPNTEYNVAIQTQDGYLETSKNVSKIFKTKLAVIVKCVQNETCERDNEETSEEEETTKSKSSSDGSKRNIALILPLVIVCLFFVLSIGVNVYFYINKRRRLQKPELPSHGPPESSNKADQKENLDSTKKPGSFYESIRSAQTDRKKSSNLNYQTSYLSPVEVIGTDEENSTKNVTKKRPSDNSIYLNVDQETEDLDDYESLDSADATADLHNQKKVKTSNVLGTDKGNSKSTAENSTARKYSVKISLNDDDDDADDLDDYESLGSPNTNADRHNATIPDEDDVYENVAYYVNSSGC